MTRATQDVSRRSALKVGPAALSSFLVAIFGLSACGTGTPVPTLLPASPSVLAAPTESPRESQPISLAGTWDTGPFETTAYPGHRQWETRVRFYEESSTPFVTISGWDPTEGGPGDGDHGPYRVLGGGQLAIASADEPQLFTTYAYSLSDGELTLTWLHNDPNGPDASDTTGPFTTITLRRQ